MSPSLFPVCGLVDPDFIEWGVKFAEQDELYSPGLVLGVTHQSMLMLCISFRLKKECQFLDAEVPQLRLSPDSSHGGRLLPS